MSKGTKITVALVLVVVIAIGAALALSSKKKDTNDTTESTTPSSSSSSNTTAAATITYNGSGFSPDTVTVKAGESVKITNGSSSDGLSFNSDPHPTHTDEPELNVGSVDPGQSKTFTVTKKGTWGYHNHEDPSQRGTIKVD